MFERFIAHRVEEALSDTPVVLVTGPRRAGKTTLVRTLGDAGRTYITLDDQTVLEAARADPTALIRGLDRASVRQTFCWQSRRGWMRTTAPAASCLPALPMY
jgi:hypothetical protein